MASPAATGSVRIHVLDCSRRPVTDDCSAFVRIVDIEKRQLPSGFQWSKRHFSQSADDLRVRKTLRGVPISPRHRDGTLFPLRALTEHTCGTPRDAGAAKRALSLRSARFDRCGPSAHPPWALPGALRGNSGMRSSKLGYPAERLRCARKDALARSLFFPARSISTGSQCGTCYRRNGLGPGFDIRLVEAIRGARCLRAFAHDPRPGARHLGIPARAGPATTGAGSRCASAWRPSTSLFMSTTAAPWT